MLVRLNVSELEAALPIASGLEKEKSFQEAADSVRHRIARILHEPGAFLNRAICYLLRDTYMQPHLHPSNEKAERIWVLEGKVAVIAFNDGGEVVDVAELEAGRLSGVQVPPFTWHTYIMLTDRVITYETMEGVYDPVTWKTFADWAPTEDSVDKESYRESLRNSSLVFIAD